MKIIFMGTPDFAAGALDALIKAGHEITLVVTQPDRAKGRSGEPVPSPVKVRATEASIPVFQPVKIKTPEAILELKKYEADVYVVAAFGQILSQEILDIPKYGCINIHASLLPKYRGASPIQHVILEGETQTGVTIMQMDKGLDTGDMLYKISTPISDEDTFETLHDRLMEIGGRAIVEALPKLEAGELTPVKQGDSDSCYARLISKDMGRIDFNRSAIEIDRQIRGMNPWPSAFTTYKGKQLKIWKAKATDEISEGEIGSITKVSKDYFSVKTGQGTLNVYELQLEGKKRMTTQAFLLGVKVAAGETLS